jgi:hypothetical protein
MGFEKIRLYLRKEHLRIVLSASITTPTTNYRKIIIYNENLDYKPPKDKLKHPV